jgi:transposase
LVVRAALPLRTVETDFAIDSTGFTSTQLVGLWQQEKYGAKRARTEHDWVKVHAVWGVKTNVVTAIEVTERNTQDAPYFVPLVTKTTEQFNVLRVMGDKAYSSYGNLELTVSKGAEPFIPFKSYAKATSPSETWNRLFGYFIMHREEFLKAYHKVECGIHILRDQARVRGFGAQQNACCAGQRSPAEGARSQYPMLDSCYVRVRHQSVFY